MNVVLLCFGTITGASVFAYIPRFLLGGLLFFAGAGFAFENLFLEYFHLPRLEFLNIYFIFVVYLASGVLAYAVVLGIVTSYVTQPRTPKPPAARLVRKSSRTN